MQPAGRRDVVDLALQSGTVRSSEAVSRSQALARLRLGDVAFRQHTSGHTDVPNWPTFLKFANKYVKPPAQ